MSQTDLENALFTLLSTDSGVSALVSTRILPEPVEEDVAYPLIEYLGISATPDYPLKGPAFDRTTVIQLKCTAKIDPGGKKLARQIADAAIAAIEGWAPAAPTGVTIHDAWLNNDGVDLPDPDQHVVRTIVDVGILWS